MIIRRPDHEPPSEWTPADIRELIDHADDLATNGNPAGFFVANGLLRVNRGFPCDPAEYDACREWIMASADLVRTAWQYGVVHDP